MANAEPSKFRWLWAGLFFVMFDKVFEGAAGQLDTWIEAKTGFQWTIYILEPIIIFLAISVQSGSFIRKYGYLESTRRNLWLSYLIAFICWVVLSFLLLAIVALDKAHWGAVFTVAALEIALVALISWWAIDWSGRRRNPNAHQLSRLIQ